MFLVILLVCSTFSPNSPCTTRKMHLRGLKNMEQCMVTADTAAVTLHIANPNWVIKGLTCMPMEET